MNEQMYREIVKRTLGGESAEREEIELLKKTIAIQQDTITQLQVTVEVQRECIESQGRQIAALKIVRDKE